MERVGTEAQRYVWEGAIPLQIHLHDSEVTTLPPPPPALILAPRIGYLPLLVPHIRPLFSSTLPPGADTVWFDYKGLPLKWYIPTGVLFDLLCAEPERPWNLTVHFRGYPGNILIPCEGEDSVKWSFINSLKEVELWRCVLNGNLEGYLRISSKLKLGTVGDDYTVNLNLCSLKSQQSTAEADTTGPAKTGRIPVRLYVWSVSEDFDDLEDAPQIDSWDKVSCINRPIDIHKEEGKCFTLGDALRTLLPELFTKKLLRNEVSRAEVGEEQGICLEDGSSIRNVEEMGEKSYEHAESCCPSDNAEVKFIRIQGIEPKLETPFSWTVKNLMNPEHFLHICMCVKVLPASTCDR
ncbi:autophagy protein 5 isoform X2 [Malania oleifera]|uniref:autophagy protein 5 isoform X2 n=1 Tax=Malania oleifera TaxID=397392 RepID=UPI0025AE2E2D|nr:autophagy protein 5 isoform X2 [Malania oleifera]